MAKKSEKNKQDSNKRYNNARKQKKNEFYTPFSVIVDEVPHYAQEFEGETVLCNCDDPTDSKFTEFYQLQFDILKLNKLRCVHYESTPGKSSYMVEYTSADKKPTWIKLKGNGAFGNEEGLELLKQKPIVCTNPPFSEQKIFLPLLVEYGVKFLVMGEIMNVTLKDVWPLVMNGKLWTGVNYNKGIEFRVPDHYSCTRQDDDGKKYAKVPGICWYTNMKHYKTNEKVTLYQKYKGNEDKFPKYDNCDAIDIGSWKKRDKIEEIPIDYKGVMGVPVTFMGKYNPNQFEIVGMDDLEKKWRGRGPDLAGKHLARRILIRHRRKGSK